MYSLLILKPRFLLKIILIQGSKQINTLKKLISMKKLLTLESASPPTLFELGEQLTKLDRRCT